MCALTRTWPILRGYLRLGTLDHLAQWRHGLYLHKIFFSLLPFNCFGIGVHVQLLYHCTYNHFLLADQDYLALWNIPVAGAILRYVSQHNGYRGAHNKEDTHIGTHASPYCCPHLSAAIIFRDRDSNRRIRPFRRSWESKTVWICVA